MTAQQLETGAYAYLPQERVIYGRAMADAVREEAGRLGAKKLFIVTSRTLATKTPAIEDLKKSLGGLVAGQFHDCVAHSPWASVLAAAAAVRAAAPDLIVTVGGGTAIDTVKVLQMCLAAGVEDAAGMRALHVSLNPDGSQHVPVVPPSPVRQIIVPTTLSGAEFSSLAGATDEETGIKRAFTSPDVCGISVIIDPRITVHTPEWLWLSTGIRAVDHAVEAVCSTAPTPFTDGLSLHALRLMAESLPANRRDPADLAMRLRSQQAVWLAGASIQRVPYGASHSIGHILGGMAGVPHGITSCILLPHVLRYNKGVSAEQDKRQALVADALGHPGGDAAAAVAELIDALGQPRSLREAGVDRALLPKMADGALENIWLRNNPRPITGASEVLGILEAAW